MNPDRHHAHPIAVAQRVKVSAPLKTELLRQHGGIVKGQAPGDDLRGVHAVLGSHVQTGEGREAHFQVVGEQAGNPRRAVEFGWVGADFIAVQKAWKEAHGAGAQPEAGGNRQRGWLARVEREIPDLVVGVIQRRQAHIRA